MMFFEIASILISLAALFSYLNFRYIRLPTTIGIMVISLAGSVILIAVGRLHPALHAGAARLVAHIDFQQTVLHGMLALLLFAGALHLDLDALRREAGVISVLSIVGTALSTILVAALSWLFFRAAKIPCSGVECILFGALISPTDPIAVLSIMKSVRAPKALEVQISGESLFNDGIGVVIFLTALEIAVSGQAPAWPHVLLLLVKQVAGGAIIGFATGLFTYRLIRNVDGYQVEILLTLALATGGFTLAEACHVSAPIAVVVAGLFIGNPGRTFAMKTITREHLDTFWELMDEILNAVLFLLIGLELLVMPLSPRYLWAGVAAIVITLFARFASVTVVLGTMRRWRKFRRGTISVLTWGGLRGGLSVAMALALPHGAHRELIVTITYLVVIFSVVVQGLSIRPLIRGSMGPGSD